MKNLSLILLMVTLFPFLFGCQLEKVAVEAETPLPEAESVEREHLLSLDGITKVEATKVKGVNPVIYGAAEELDAFLHVLSSAAKEPGTANVAEPELYLKLTNNDMGNQWLYLWVGEAGEQSMLMNTEDTHSVYTVTATMTAELIELIEK